MSNLVHVNFRAHAHADAAERALIRDRARMAQGICPRCGRKLEARSLLVLLPRDGVAYHTACSTAPKQRERKHARFGARP